MKYKNIDSAIHNFGHSFTSLMNYVRNGYVIDDLQDIHNQGYDIEIDWKLNSFTPQEKLTDKISESIFHYSNSLEKLFSSQNVDIEKIQSLKFIWPKGKRKFMEAIDDRNKTYKMFVNETK